MFLCLFCARFALLKTGHSNRNLIKKGLKIELFLQKTQKFFCVFYLRPLSKVKILTPHPFPPSFKKFSLDTLNSEQKPSVKNRSTGRSTGDDFEIYRSGRVEKILTGSIFDSKETISKYYLRCLIRLIFAMCDISLTLESFQKFFLYIFRRFFLQSLFSSFKKTNLCL